MPSLAAASVGGYRFQFVCITLKNNKINTLNFSPISFSFFSFFFKVFKKFVRVVICYFFIFSLPLLFSPNHALINHGLELNSFSLN